MVSLGIFNSPFTTYSSPLILFVFFVQTMTTATITKLFKLKPSGRVLFILCRYVVALFALGTLQYNVIAWHNFYLYT